ncbi:MAG: hypothetical protein ABI251_16140 [Mycobacteriaceae bacterium]
MPATPSSFPTVLSRRCVLLGGAGLVISGCSLFGEQPRNQSTPDVATPDPLLVVSAAARADAAAATQLAATSPPQVAVLQSIAAERTAHAQALDAEITRAAGTSSPSSTPAPAVPAPVVAPTPAPTAASLRAGLQEHQRAATQLAYTVAPYRAGLLGSIAAACATQLAVLP